MKILAKTCIATMLMFGCAVAQERPQVISIPLSRPGDPISVEIDILSARIEVIGEDRKDAQFEITVAGGNRKIVTPSGTRTLSNSGYEFVVEEDDNHVEFDTNVVNSRINLLARVPRRANLELNTVNNGEIIVRNIEGKLELKNVNGPITASDISGTVIAEAINKNISVGFVSLGANEVSALSSINGDLILTLPAKTGVELQLDSYRGKIVSDFEVDVKPSEPIVERDEHRDGISVRVENTIVAAINGGGPVIKLKTLNGDIQINKID